MKLADFENARPYESVIAILRDPEAHTAREPENKRQPRVRDRLRQFLRLLRQGQLQDVAKLIASPLIERSSPRRAFASDDDRIGSNFALREPRSVSRDFIGRVARDVRVSGLQPARDIAGYSDFNLEDRVFAEVLSWIVDMRAHPMEREPLRDRVKRTHPMGGYNWTETAGPVLGLFVEAAFEDSSQHGSSRAMGAYLAEMLSSRGMTQTENADTHPRAYIDARWASQLVSEGAKKLRDLGNGKRSTRRML